MRGVKNLKLYRRLVQLLVLIGLALLPWAKSLDLNLQGSFFALQLGPISFADPAAALGILAGEMWPEARILLGALLTLLIAFFFGRIFCSWICPYGFFSEIIHSFRAQKHENNPHAFFRKLLLLIFSAVLTGFFGLPLLMYLSFPGELSLVPLLVWQNTYTIIGGIVALPTIFLIIEAWTGFRLWCRYFCPQSVLLGAAQALLPSKFVGLRVRWMAQKCQCKGQAPCQKACSLDLNPRALKRLNRLECTNCGDCVQACASKGQALSFKFKNN